MSADDFNPKTPEVHGDKRISQAHKWQKLASRVGNLDGDVLAVIQGFLVLLGYTDELANAFMSKRKGFLHDTGLDFPTITLLLENPHFYEGLRAVSPADSVTRTRFMKVMQTVAGAEWRISPTNRLANAVHGTISIKALAYILAAGASVGAELTTLCSIWGQIKAPDPNTGLYFGEDRDENYHAVCTLPFIDTIPLPLPEDSSLETIRCVFRWSQEVGDAILDEIDVNVVSIDWNGDVRDVCYHFKQDLECKSGRQLSDEETKELVTLSDQLRSKVRSAALGKQTCRSQMASGRAAAANGSRLDVAEINFSGKAKLPGVTSVASCDAVRRHRFRANRVIAAEDHTWAQTQAPEEQDTAEASNEAAAPSAAEKARFQKFAHKPHFRWWAEGFGFELDRCSAEVAAHVIVLNAPVAGENLRTVQRVRMEVFNDQDELVAECPLDFKHVTGAECVIAALQRAPISKRKARATPANMFSPPVTTSRRNRSREAHTPPADSADNVLSGRAQSSRPSSTRSGAFGEMLETLAADDDGIANNADDERLPAPTSTNTAPSFDPDSLLSLEEYRMAHFGSAYRAQSGIHPETIGYEEFEETRTTVGHNQVRTQVRTGWEFRAVCRQVQRRDVHDLDVPQHFLCALPLCRKILDESGIILGPKKGSLKHIDEPSFPPATVTFVLADDGNSNPRTSAPNAATQQLLDNLQYVKPIPRFSVDFDAGASISEDEQRLPFSPSPPPHIEATAEPTFHPVSSARSDGANADAPSSHGGQHVRLSPHPEVRQAFRSRPVFNPFAMETGDLLPIPWSATETSLRIGLGWASKPAPTDALGVPIPPVEPIDLDVTILAYAGLEFFDQVDFGNLLLKGGGMLHGGDNQDGETDGDDESVTINLDQMDPSVSQLFVFVTLFQGGEFKQLDDISVRLVIDCSAPGSAVVREKEVCRYNTQVLLQDTPSSHKAILVSQIKLDDVGWAFHGVHMSSKGQTQADFHDMLNPHLTIFKLMNVKGKWIQKVRDTKERKKRLKIQRKATKDERQRKDLLASTRSRDDDTNPDVTRDGSDGIHSEGIMVHKSAIQHGTAPLRLKSKMNRQPATKPLLD